MLALLSAPLPVRLAFDVVAMFGLVWAYWLACDLVDWVRGR
jgi:hypothetical protein